MTSRDGASSAVAVSSRTAAAAKARQAYEANEAQYLLLLNSTAEGIYRLDMHGVCTYCNPTAVRLLGYRDARQLLGKPAHEHHRHSHPHGSSFHSDDEVFLRADGGQFHAECWSHPIVSGPDIAGTVVTFLDITQRRSLEEQFLQSQKMEIVGMLTGGVAHDFNNALQAILAYGELLEERLPDDSIGIDYARQILLAGRRAAALTRQLLALSRKQLSSPVLFDLNTATLDIEEMLRMTLGGNIRLSVNRSPRIGTIEADRGHLQQILMNLAINARDAMPDGGELVISTADVEMAAADVPAGQAPGTYAMLSVRDTGEGMDSATRARIFEPFFTTKAPGKGTGLGLSTVGRIVKQSGGFIVVDSEMGRGTEFKLYFPVVSGAPEELLPQAASRLPLHGSETILLIDRENHLRAVIRDTLKANGYQVLEAANGASAVALAGEFAAPIDLLLTDATLPGFSGQTLAARLLLSRPRLKVIFMSGHNDDFLDESGSVDPRLLAKPFSKALLLLKVRRCLDGEAAD